MSGGRRPADDDPAGVSADADVGRRRRRRQIGRGEAARDRRREVEGRVEGEDRVAVPGRARRAVIGLPGADRVAPMRVSRQRFHVRWFSV